MNKRALCLNRFVLELRAAARSTISLSIAAVVTLVSCHSASPDVRQTSQELTLGTCELGVPCGFVMATPSTLLPSSLVLSATSSLQIDNGVTVKETNGAPAVIANLGTGTTQIGTDCKLGDIWSDGPVTIADRTTVNGTIHGAVPVNVGNSVSIKAKDSKAFPSVTTSSTITFPATNSGNMDLEPGVTGRLNPGAYGSVVVKSNALLNLSVGSYLMDGLDLEPSSTLALDTTAGPIRLYVRKSAILRGKITSATDARDLTLVYFGSADLNVEAPLSATVIASIAKITLKSVTPLSGAFFGRSIEVSPGDTVTHVPTRAAVITIRNGRIEAETLDASSGGTNTGTTVTGVSGGAWLLYRGVNFGTPGQFNRVRFNLLSPSGTDEIVVRLDSLTGPVAAALQSLPTGSGFIVESAALSPGISGVHDTYVFFNGTEMAGLDWFELYKAPGRRVVVTQAPRLSPDAGFPDLGATPGEEQDDAPEDAVWLDLPQNVQIPAHGADGIAFTNSKTATYMVQARWKAGSGPVSIQLLDSARNPLTPLFTHSYPADKKFIAEWASVPPQNLSVVVNNAGATAVTVNVLVGFVPVP
jgi:hypothetical protein